MGLLSWVRKKLIGFDLNDVSDVEKLATEYLKSSTKIHSDTLKTAQKINQANLLAMQQKQLREALRAGLDGDDEDDFDDDEEDDEGQEMTDRILSKALENILSGNNEVKQADLTPQKESSSSLRKRAGKTLKNMSDEQLNILASKGFI